MKPSISDYLNSIETMEEIDTQFRFIAFNKVANKTSFTFEPKTPPNSAFY